MVLIAFGLTPINLGEAAATTMVYVFDPITQGDTSSAAVDETFTLEVKVADVQYLVGFEFYLVWNTSLLEFVQVTEGPFLNSTGAYPSMFTAKYPGFPGWLYPDRVYAASALIGAQLSTSASGTGVLARVTFRVLAEGVGVLDLQDTALAKYDPFKPKPIVHSTEDGYFAYPLPLVVVEPAEVLGILPGDSFNVNISAIGVSNVYNWTLKMRWAAGLLNATSIVEGSFLSDAGATDFVSVIDQDNGVLNINNTLTGDPLSGVSGSGRLATITFTPETRGKTDLELFAVRLYKQDGSVSPAAVESSSFSNTLRDVAITDSALSTGSVSQGQKVNITVTVKNKGVENETFTVRVDYDSKTVESKPVSKLFPNVTQTLTYQWDTSNVEPKSYTIKAVIVETIPGEVNKDDNVRTIGTVTVTGSGTIDFNLLLIGGAIAAAVVVVLAVFFLKRRK